jgi:DNA-binding MarR family transcriptional regulator
MTAPVPQLTDHLGYWLRQVSNHVSLAFARKLATMDVTVAEWALMRTLYDEPPMPPSQLADRMGLTRGAVTKLANRLIAKRLLTRTADPDDSRTHTLGLTRKAAGLVPRLAALADQNDAEAFAYLSDRERNVLHRILHRMVTRHGITALAVD